MSGPKPATGHQHEIRHGPAVARIGEVAAVLREFSVADVHFTETWDDGWVPPMGCGIVLVPWPNRVADARWTYRGKPQLLDITDLANGHATHGLLRNTAYRPVSGQDRSLTLAASIYPQHGYPFTLDTQVSYALTDDGLKVTHQLTNAGGDGAPFGVGAHPYLRVGDHPIGDLVITLSGRDYAPTDDRSIPIGVQPVDGTPVDLRSGVRLDGLDADLAFTGFATADGIVEHRLDAPDGTGVVLWADEVFRWAQVYSPSNFPGPGKPNQRKAIALEPMTCGANALNTGQDLIWLAPGDTWTASWGLRPVGF
jgi:aldose 1-epimerase